MSKVDMKDESYIINLCDQVLMDESKRQWRFDFLRGDKAVKENGKIVEVLQEQGVRLPVDAFYESKKLVIEYLEIQHFKPVKHFDKPDKITSSGVVRSDQRKIYDNRRRKILSQNGISHIELCYTDFKHKKNGRLIRNEADDKTVILKKLRRKGFCVSS